MGVDDDVCVWSGGGGGLTASSVTDGDCAPHDICNSSKSFQCHALGTVIVTQGVLHRMYLKPNGHCEATSQPGSLSVLL